MQRATERAEVFFLAPRPLGVVTSVTPLALPSRKIWRALAALVLPLAACSPPRSEAKLQVELELMASCPFAAELLSGLLPALDALAEHVHVEVSYVGRMEGGRPSSMYGTPELGRATEALCAKELGGTRAWKSYVRCTLGNDPATGCTERTGLDQVALESCARGTQGAQLLAQAYTRAEQKGITASPTLKLDGVRSAGSRAAASLARALCASPATRHEPYCVALPAPTPVKVTVIDDRPCADAACAHDPVLGFVRANLPAARLERLSSRDADGARLIAAARVESLPVAVFDLALKKEAELYRKLQPWLTELPDGRGLVLELAGRGPAQPL